MVGIHDAPSGPLVHGSFSVIFFCVTNRVFDFLLNSHFPRCGHIGIRWRSSMTKPEADPVAAVTLPEVPNVKHLWQRATLLWNGMFKFILNLVGALAFVLFAMLLYQIATERSIVIEPISVPQSLAANGYTPEVAARR